MLTITPGERAALQLLADGKRMTEIAMRLHIPECQIDEHLSTLFERLGAADRTDAIVAAFKRGLIVIKPAVSHQSDISNLR